MSMRIITLQMGLLDLFAFAFASASAIAIAFASAFVLSLLGFALTCS